MSTEADRLEQLKSKMTSAQRQHMAEIIQNELRAREQAKKTGAQNGARVAKQDPRTSALGPEHVRGIYGDVDKRLRETKIEDLQKKIKSQKGTLNWKQFGASLPAMGKSALLMAGVVCFAVAKVIFSTGVVDASVESKAHTVVPSVPVPVTPTSAQENVHAGHGDAKWTNSERELLSELDNRRVELERRKQALDEREADLRRQESELASRIVDLKSLTARFSEQRKEKDQKREARLEQLANVYGSMAPTEAAPLIARLDDDISLTLLERMPEKRLGQILSSMNQDRAIALTKQLTERKAR